MLERDLGLEVQFSLAGRPWGVPHPSPLGEGPTPWGSPTPALWGEGPTPWGVPHPSPLGEGPAGQAKLDF